RPQWGVTMAFGLIPGRPVRLASGSPTRARPPPPAAVFGPDLPNRTPCKFKILDPIGPGRFGSRWRSASSTEVLGRDKGNQFCILGLELMPVALEGQRGKGPGRVLSLHPRELLAALRETQRELLN